MKWYRPAVHHKLMFSNRYNPDVIFLQEVIPPYYSLLKKRARSYEIITGNSFPVIYLVFFFKKCFNEKNKSKLAYWSIGQKKVQTQ